jgi:5-hydroxyisourate hydrolase
MTFFTGDWFAAEGTQGFYPLVTVVCTISDPAAHHHIPLLISPYGYSTYRGS